MKPTPKNWPRIANSIFYDDAPKAIDWLCEAFGFEVRLKVEGEGGRIEHSELEYGEGLIMVGQVDPDLPHRAWGRSPASLGGACTQAMAIFVDDADAHCARARKAGALIETEPETHDYGDDYWADRTYLARDFEGHRWWFMQRLKGDLSA